MTAEPTPSPAVRAPVEFECADCHYHVHTYLHEQVPDPPLCACCVLIREHVTDPVMAAELRALLSP